MVDRTLNWVIISNYISNINFTYIHIRQPYEIDQLCYNHINAWYLHKVSSYKCGYSKYIPPNMECHQMWLLKVHWKSCFHFGVTRCILNTLNLGMGIRTQHKFIYGLKIVDKTCQSKFDKRWNPK